MITFLGKSKIKQLVRIEKDTFPDSAWDAKYFRDMFNNKVLFLGYLYGADLVGYVAVQQNGYIDSLGVLKTHRRLGVGLELMKSVESLCRETKIKKLRLHVDMTNNSAIRLYLKLNYKITGITKNYYHKNQHALRMEKAL